MNSKPDVLEKLGRTLNELDIDFSSFTLVGWLVSLIALLVGGVVAGFFGWLISRRNGINASAGMAFMGLSEQSVSIGDTGVPFTP